VVDHAGVTTGRQTLSFVAIPALLALIVLVVLGPPDTLSCGEQLTTTQKAARDAFRQQAGASFLVAAVALGAIAWSARPTRFFAGVAVVLGLHALACVIDPATFEWYAFGLLALLIAPFALCIAVVVAVTGRSWTPKWTRIAFGACAVIGVLSIGFFAGLAGESLVWC
jgi:hypothetical protein